jgi:hypothetical protein
MTAPPNDVNYSSYLAAAMKQGGFDEPAIGQTYFTDTAPTGFQATLTMPRIQAV